MIPSMSERGPVIPVIYDKSYRVGGMFGYIDRARQFGIYWRWAGLASEPVSMGMIVMVVN